MERFGEDGGGLRECDAIVCGIALPAVGKALQVVGKVLPVVGKVLPVADVRQKGVNIQIRSDYIGWVTAEIWGVMSWGHTDVLRFRDDLDQA